MKHFLPEEGGVRARDGLPIKVSPSIQVWMEHLQPWL